MSAEQAIKEIPVGELTAEVLRMKHEGWRLMQIHATKRKGDEPTYEVSYSFVKEYELYNLRIVVTPETEIMSISDIYGPAFLYENEMTDLFWLNIKMISLDYHGNLYRLDNKTPFK